jgi:predicted nucleotidyltransferase
MNNLSQYIFFTAGQKVIEFLSANADKQYTEKEISDSIRVKRSSINLALHTLNEEGLVSRKKIGRTSLYGADANHIIIKELKTLQNLLLIYPLIEKLKTESQKIILFGSNAKGSNTAESDIDIFVQTNNVRKIREIVDSSQLKNKIQLIVKTPKEMLIINNQKPLFFQEIEKGKLIWENYGK